MWAPALWNTAHHRQHIINPFRNFVSLLILLLMVSGFSQTVHAQVGQLLVVAVVTVVYLMGV